MNQNQIEKLMHPKHIAEDVKNELIEHAHERIVKCVEVIKKWCDVNEWESRNIRKAHLASLDLYDLVCKMTVTITMNCIKPLPMASVIGMISIPGMEKIDSIRTTSELLVLLEPIKFFKLVKMQGGTVMVCRNLAPSESLASRMELYCYLPPLIERPDVLEHNKSSGYKTFDSDSLILGYRENFHNKSISLDVLNTLNRNKYELDEDFIANYEKNWHRTEQTSEELLVEYELQSIEDDGFKGTFQEFVQQYEQDKVNWANYQEQFKVLHKHLQGNTIYLTNKVDKRGRVYVQGHHFSTQGTSFEKACINLAKKETVYGEL